MNYVYLGRIVNTHGIKGEVRIISDFEYKDRVFNIGSIIYYGSDKEELKINSYRRHKNFDMITFNDIKSINDVLKYKGGNVYINRDDLKLNDEEYIKSDLLGMEAIYNNEVIGLIDSIEKNGLNELMIINNKLIPYNKHFIARVDRKENKVYLENVGGLLWK